MIAPEQIAHIEQLLKVLQASGVRQCKIGEMSFELGPVPNVYRPPFPGLSIPSAGPADETPDARLFRQKREFDELLYASTPTAGM